MTYSAILVVALPLIAAAGSLYARGTGGYESATGHKSISHEAAPPTIDPRVAMLREECDFSTVVLDCVDAGMIVPAYASLRSVIERAHVSSCLLYADDVKWEYNSMARHQQFLDRKLQSSSLDEVGWVKESLEGIRRWNRPLGDGGKPISMRKPGFHDVGWPAMSSWMKEWYDLCSWRVHPTFWGEEDVGRAFRVDEVGEVVRVVHLCLCSTGLIVDVLERAMREESND